jgi:hypothetical protein
MRMVGGILMVAIGYVRDRTSLDTHEIDERSLAYVHGKGRVYIDI